MEIANATDLINVFLHAWERSGIFHELILDLFLYLNLQN